MSWLINRAVHGLAVVLLVACSREPQPPTAPTNPNVVQVSSEANQELAIESVHTKSLGDSHEFVGRTQYSLDGVARVGTPLVGIVRSAEVKLGEKVEAGQTLVIIESADISVAYSDFAKAESTLQLTQRYLELSKDLYSAKSMSKKEYEQAQNDYQKAEAEHNRARQRLLTLRVPGSELDKPAPERHISTRFDLRSPLRGVVVEKTVTVGQVVGQDPAQTLFTIADLDVLEVVANVYERDLPLLQAGMGASVSLESFPTERFPAKVIYIGDVVDPDTRTVKMRCKVTNLGRKLRPEMLARVQVQLGSTLNAVVVPREAVVRREEDMIVFVQTSDTVYEPRIVLATPTADEMMEVQGKVVDGERVVVKGAVLLRGVWERQLAARGPQPEIGPRTIVDSKNVPATRNGSLRLVGKIAFGEDYFSNVASPVQGRVLEVKTTFGDPVHPGQVLLVIDSPDITGAYADYLKEISELEFARRSYEMAQGLYQTEATAFKDLKQAENDLVREQAEYSQARERLLVLKVPREELDKPFAQQKITGRFELKSPIAGTLVNRTVTIGQWVDPSQVLMVAANLDRLQVVADVYEQDVPRVHVGDVARVNVDAYPDQAFGAVIASIGDVVDRETRTVKVRAWLSNEQHKLKPEMYVRLTVGSQS